MPVAAFTEACFLSLGSHTHGVKSVRQTAGTITHGTSGSRDLRRKRLNYRIHDNRPIEPSGSMVQHGHRRKTV